MKITINIMIGLLLTVSASGQLKPVSDHYVLNPMMINPAFAGNRGVLNIATFYRQQWVGVTGAPETMTFSADAPFAGDKIGLGISIARDKIGVTNETSFNSIYAYKLKLGESNLSFGLGAGLITSNTAWSHLVTIEPGEENSLIDSKIFVLPDFNFGLYYSLHNYFVGFSIPKLLSYNFDIAKNRYAPKANPLGNYYLLNTGYLLNISPKIKFLPSTLVSFSPGEKILLDINSHFDLLDKFWLGSSYRYNRSLAGFFQLEINKQLRVAYTYNYDFGKLSKYSNGSHEVMLRYEFRYKVDAINPLVF